MNTHPYSHYLDDFSDPATSRPERLYGDTGSHTEEDSCMFHACKHAGCMQSVSTRCI